MKWPIIGHKNIVSFLENSLQEDNLHHAYIFAGPKNIGKKTLANFFIQSIHCFSLGEKNPCATCESCKIFSSRMHPDHMEVWREKNEKTKSLKKNIGIEQIKSVREKLSSSSFFRGKKTLLIAEAETLSEKAANALLKTLEEPPRGSVVILITSKIQDMASTVRSRCQILYFFPVNTNEIYESLRERGIERDKAKICSRISNGCPGIALDFAIQNNVFSQYQEKMKKIFELFRKPDHEKLMYAQNLFTSYNKSQTLEEELLGWERVLRDMLLVKSSCPHLICNFFFKNDIEDISKNFSYQYIKNIFLGINQAREYARNNVHPQYVYENFLIHI